MRTAGFVTAAIFLQRREYDGSIFWLTAVGDLGAQIFDMFVRVPGKHRFLVGGRNENYVRQRTNLSVLAAEQLGFYPHVTCTSMDLWNIDQTTQTMKHFQPDIIFCSATLQPWRVISTLPKPLAERLYKAQMGPWLPVHLTLVYKLMQAVKQVGQSVTVINASYPDVVNAVLGKVNMALTTGVGDLANNIPALRKSITLKLGKPQEQVDVRFFAQRYLSYRISRAGNTGGAPFHLTALVNGIDLTHLLDMETIFELLPTKFKRLGGTPGHLMTAASATVVFESIVNDTGKITHAPGPNSLIGGYPVKVREKGVEVVLPEGLSIGDAIQVNEKCLKFDGIEHIDENGTVYFAEREMSIMKEMLAYKCSSMRVSETEHYARELLTKYGEFVQKAS